MAEPTQTALLQEKIGKFVEEAVTRTVNQRMDEAMQKSGKEIQARIHQMVELGLRSLTTEGERIIERTCQRMAKAAEKSTDELSMTIQESIMAMNKENELFFRRRAEEWMKQMLADNVEVVRNRMLLEITETSKATCDRNLFDLRSEFENHVNRCFQGMADRLSAPLTRPSSTTVRPS